MESTDDADMADPVALAASGASWDRLADALGAPDADSSSVRRRISQMASRDAHPSSGVPLPRRMLARDALREMNRTNGGC